MHAAPWPPIPSSSCSSSSSSSSSVLSFSYLISNCRVITDLQVLLRSACKILHKRSSYPYIGGSQQFIPACFQTSSLPLCNGLGEWIELLSLWSASIVQGAFWLQATPSLKLTQPDRPINAHDIQNLVAWVLGDRSESRNPQWIFVQVWD